MNKNPLTPLWDSDVLLYQIGYAAESYWKLLHLDKGVEINLEESPPPFSVVEEMLFNRLFNTHSLISGGTLRPLNKPILFFSGSTNFRNEISTTGYKIRSGKKPYHYKNLKAFIKSEFEVVEQEGLEADDLMAIEATKDPDNAIIIGIDKDLLQVPTWHYLYEYGKVASFGPLKVEGYGQIWLDDKGKLRGYGEKFFYAQCIMGDPVDSIIGIPNSGPAKAFNLLGGTKTPEEGFKAVREAYKAFYGDSSDDKLLENGRLLWMTRELKDNKPVLWSFPNGYNSN